MGHPVRAVSKNRLESALPRRLSICPGSATRTVLVLFADERRGIFRVAPGADIYSLSSAGKSALRDSHRLGRQGHHRNEALTPPRGVMVRASARVPPGPRFPLLELARYLRDPCDRYVRLARRYGDPFSARIPWGRLVVTGDPSGVQQLFSASPDSFEPWPSDPFSS